MKILTIVGARPQFIKAAAISRVWRNSLRHTEVLVHTGQHYDENMSDVFFKELEIPRPDYNLEIGSSTHGAQTGRMLEAIEIVISREKPDCVLVYGDTNSTLAGALAAVKLHIPVAHVEAGLRSFNRLMPEEVNRVIVDHISTLLFTPTTQASANLALEGISEKSIIMTGDVMLDVTLSALPVAEKTSKILDSLSLTPKKYVLATLHRAENTDSQVILASILESLKTLSQETQVVIPLHPRTRKAVTKLPMGKEILDCLLTIEPVGYLDMLKLTRHASIVVTDSGGLQKEAFFHKVPCVTIRNETEWVETVDCGANILAMPSETEFHSRFQEACRSQMHCSCSWPAIYGDGAAAELICTMLAGGSNR